MNRRKLIKYGLCAPAVTLPVGVLADTFENPKPNYEAKYWEAQVHIDKLEEMLNDYKINRELANHYEALELNKKFVK